MKNVYCLKNLWKKFSKQKVFYKKGNCHLNKKEYNKSKCGKTVATSWKQPGLHIKIQASLDYIAVPWMKTTKTNKWNHKSKMHLVVRYELQCSVAQELGYSYQFFTYFKSARRKDIECYQHKNVGNIWDDEYVNYLHFVITNYIYISIQHTTSYKYVQFYVS